MKKTSLEIVYQSAKKSFKQDKPLTIGTVAKKSGLCLEWTRKNILKLVDMGLIKRNKFGKITSVK